MNSSSKGAALFKDPKAMRKLMESSFQKVDLDKNEALDRKEFEQVLIQISREVGVDIPTKDEVDDLLTLLDENGNNKIEFEEFCNLIEKVFQIINSTG